MQKTKFYTKFNDNLNISIDLLYFKTNYKYNYLPCLFFLDFVQ